MSAKLINLIVTRVDAVDSPATGLPFLIIKSEEPDEMQKGAEELAKAAADVIEALSKETPDTAETLASLNVLAQLLGLNKQFNAPEAEEPNMPDLTPEINALKSELADVKTLVEQLAKSETGSASNQPDGQETAVNKAATKVGDGLFANLFTNFTKN